MPETADTKVWFITGTSSGLGLHLVKAVLARGDLVIATVRDKSKLENIEDRFPAEDSPEGQRLRVVDLDVTLGIELISRVVESAIEVWGRIDVLVNNAAYAEIGAFEELGSRAFRAMYDINVFGVIDVTNAVLPHMRERRSGTIVQVGSRLAWEAERPGRSIFASSKAAVHAFTESLASEVLPFNIHVLSFQPGGFRTEAILATPIHSVNPIRDYDDLRTRMVDRLTVATEKVLVGDPRKGMNVLVDVVRGEGKAQGNQLPRYLVLGPGAAEVVIEKCKVMQEAAQEWRWVTEDLWLDT